MGCGLSGEIGGKPLVPIPGFLARHVIASVTDTEKLMGKPGNQTECFCVFDNNYGIYTCRLVTQGIYMALLQNLYRTDVFYCDEQFIQWSTSPKGENKANFENFSDRFRRRFPGYHLDSTMHIRADPGTPVVNLKDLMTLF